jgi:hypothetical protein
MRVREVKEWARHLEGEGDVDFFKLFIYELQYSLLCIQDA